MFGFLLMEDNFPVVNKGGFSDATCSNYMSISSSCSYFMEDFDDRSTLFDNGDIVQLLVETCFVTGINNTAFVFSTSTTCVLFCSGINNSMALVFFHCQESGYQN